jgi:hypothetical protein
MDRETLQHLAEDTGLRPEDISGEKAPSPSSHETAQHLASDTNLPAETFEEDSADIAAAATIHAPVD